jgi:filamentous hemagglutinin
MKGWARRAVQAEPRAEPDYLIEIHPVLTNARNFLSSDYFFAQIGVNPAYTPKRLGDGFYEQQLVRNQITVLTGKAALRPYANLVLMTQR